MTPHTKIELNAGKIARLEDLDELAKVLFPGNRNHQRCFLAIFVELKWAPDQFLPTLEPITDKHNISRRTLETVRAKMRRLGLIDHVSRFNQKHGYREGWVLSGRFSGTLLRVSELYGIFRICKGTDQELKDRQLHNYL